MSNVAHYKLWDSVSARSLTLFWKIFEKFDSDLHWEYEEEAGKWRQEFIIRNKFGNHKFFLSYIVKKLLELKDINYYLNNTKILTFILIFELKEQDAKWAITHKGFDEYREIISKVMKLK